ncbi:hypothetical protein ACS0TY_028740 [Phlomoides rotata]
MAGVNYMESGLVLENLELRSPSYLTIVAEENQSCRSVKNGGDEDKLIKQKIKGWAKAVAAMEASSQVKFIIL